MCSRRSSRPRRVNPSSSLRPRRTEERRRMARGKSKAPEAGAVRAGAGVNPKVLVVNDEEGSCELVCRLLAEAGYPVERAANPDQALSIIDVLRPGCVVLDLSAGGIARNLQVLDGIRSQLDRTVSSMRVVLVAHQTST